MTKRYVPKGTLFEVGDMCFRSDGVRSLILEKYLDGDVEAVLLARDGVCEHCTTGERDNPGKHYVEYDREPPELVPDWVWSELAKWRLTQ